MESVDDNEIGATGNVVIRKSERSLTKPRRAIAATGDEDVKVNDSAVESPFNGGSSRNAAICLSILKTPSAPIVPGMTQIASWHMGFVLGANATCLQADMCGVQS